MPQVNQHTFTHKELAEILVKELGITEGLWGVYLEFKLAAANLGPTETDILPSAVVPVAKIGIQRFEKENNLTVNAAELRKKKPKQKGKTPKSG